MAKNKSSRGEMRDVGGVKGAHLTEIPELESNAGASTPKPVNEPKPTVQMIAADEVRPPLPKVVRLTVQTEFGGFEEKRDSLEAARDRAEDIIANGAWQKSGNQHILHSPGTIHRVIVSE